MASWTRDGIAGLQSVVLYSLPELDGAIDTVPLGGLVGNNIFLVAERVKRLSQRIKKWVHLRQTQAQVRVTAMRFMESVRCCAQQSFRKCMHLRQTPALGRDWGICPACVECAAVPSQCLRQCIEHTCSIHEHKCTMQARLAADNHPSSQPNDVP